MQDITGPRLDPHDLQMVAFHSDPITQARDAIIAVDTEMQRNYSALKASLLPHLGPVIVVENNDVGGRYTLIHQGIRETLNPIGPVFELVKSVCHTPLGIYVIIAPYLLLPDARGWMPQLTAFRKALAGAKRELGAAQLPPDARRASQRILKRGLRFIDKSLDSGSISITRFKKFTAAVHDAITTNMGFAAQAQTTAVIALMQRWKQQLGDEQWRKLYVVVLSIWTTSVRNQNSIILQTLLDPAHAASHLIDISTAEKPSDPIQLALDNLGRVVMDNVAAELIFPSDQVLADSLKGPEDLLSNAIDSLLQCPYSRKPAANP